MSEARCAGPFLLKRPMAGVSGFLLCHGMLDYSMTARARERTACAVLITLTAAVVASGLTLQSKHLPRHGGASDRHRLSRRNGRLRAAETLIAMYEGGDHIYATVNAGLIGPDGVPNVPNPNKTAEPGWGHLRRAEYPFGVGDRSGPNRGMREDTPRRKAPG